MMEEALRRDREREWTIRTRELNSGGIGVMSNPAFTGKKGIYDDEEITVAFDGLIVNMRELGFTSDTAYPEAVAGLFQKHGESFVKDLRGNFVIAVYHKKEAVLYLYTDHFGTKPLYYHTDDAGFYFSSEMKALLPVGGYPKRVNRTALIDTFAMGYVVGKKTLVEEIHRVPEGSRMEYPHAGNGSDTHTYFSISDLDVEPGIGQLNQELREHFFRAVDRMLSTAADSGYRPLITLSGGLDSRAVLSAAVRLGYDDIQTLTFAESGSGDDVYASQIARALGTYHMFQAYDGGDWLVDFLDRSIRAGEGMYHYLDIARMLFSLRNLDLGEFGLVHTGTLGDSLMGSHITLKDLKRDENDFPEDELVDAVIHRLSFGSYNGFAALVRRAGDGEEILGTLRKSIGESLKDYDLSGNGWCRAFHRWDIENRQRAILGYARGIEEFGEPGSPFYDVDFFRTAWNIPYHNRVDRRYYIRFLIEEILDERIRHIPWEKTGTPLRRNDALMRLESRIRKLPDYLLRRVSSERLRKSSSKPYFYWIQENSRLKNYIVDEIKSIGSLDMFCMDKRKTDVMLNKWYNHPDEQRDLFLPLIYLLTAGKWVETLRDYTSIRLVEESVS